MLVIFLDKSFQSYLLTSGYAPCYPIKNHNFYSNNVDLNSLAVKTKVSCYFPHYLKAGHLEEVKTTSFQLTELVAKCDPC